MIFFHRTTQVAAGEILRNGFRDNTGTYMTGQEFTGVWLSHVPLDYGEGVKGPTLLRIHTTLTEGDLADFEWIEEGKPYREWLVPADLINTTSRIEEVSLEEEGSVSVRPIPAIDRRITRSRKQTLGLADPTEGQIGLAPLRRGRRGTVQSCAR